ncbi:MAG: M20 family metallopeptidase [Bacillota bacterium]|jgi:aminobenzoyl-glutamate utilization protein B
MDKSRLYQLVEENRHIYTDLSDRVWEYAETRFEEEKSAAAICEVLEQLDFRVERNAGGVPHAFIGTWGSGSPVIGFLGEYDALSGLSQEAGVAERKPIVPGGNGHGCCHQLLGVGALAAAVAYRDYLRENNLPGTVKYFGCPGEEGGSGKAFMARAHLFDNLDAAITWHSGSMHRVSTGSSLANIQVYYRFIGKASHAGGSPHLGRSALDAVELMNVGVNYMREHVITEARVHYAVINTGGKSPNVVQPEAEVLYLIRAPKNDLVKEIFAWVCDIARGAALMTQTKVEIQIDKACSNTIPIETLEKVMYENLIAAPMPQATEEEIQFAKAIRATLSADELRKEAAALAKGYGTIQGRKLQEQLAGKELCDMVLPFAHNDHPSGGSTDVGDVSWNVPTVQCNTSCYALGTPGHSWQQVAQGKSSWAHKGMLFAAKAMAGTALDLHQNPDVLEAAKQELRELTGPEGYVCPIPEGVNPSPVK